ncbi:MAG: PQQ-binding-like beta-propeller repeat protein [Verrucomicrobiota bacterium]
MMRSTITLIVGGIIYAAGYSTLLFADDWPQWRGVNRDGISKETIPTNASGSYSPEIAWTKNLGTGCSSMIVVGDKLYTMGNKSDQDIVYCLDVASGDSLWTFKYACELDARQFEGGPGATPIFVDGKIITLSHEGHLYCLDAATGKEIWKTHLIDDLRGDRPKWGFSGSPLVLDDKVYVDAGGTSGVVCLSLKDGSKVWASKGRQGGASYGAPISIGEGSSTSVAFFRAQGLEAFKADDGSREWSYPWKTSWDINATTPLLAGNSLYASSGYGSGAFMLKLGGSNPKEIWTNKEFQNQMTTPVLKDGYLYGAHVQHVGKKKSLAYKCVKWDTGEIAWTDKSIAMAATILVGDKLMILTQNGDLIIAEPSPKKFALLSQTNVLSGGRSWVDPIFSRGNAYCRNNEGELVKVSFN